MFKYIMYLFSYGSNTNQTHINKYSKANYITNGTLKDYELKFNHFGLYGNIVKSLNNNVRGTIHKLNNINKDLKKKEFMYKLIDVKVKGNDKKNYDCKTFISMFAPFELFVLKKYKDLLVEGYKSHNLELPNIKHTLSLSYISILINFIGALFAIYLLLLTKFKVVGIILFFVDITMVIDEMYNTNNYKKLRANFNNLYYLIFKVIPLFIVIYIILNSIKYSLVWIFALIVLIVDIFTLIKYTMIN
jgi:hypothetical protein